MTRQRAVMLAPYLALLLVVTGLAWYAVDAHGAESQQPHLHDNGVWVVNDASRYFGRLNKSIDQLDAGYFAASGHGDLDIVQDGAAVVGVSPGTVSVIDPATVDVPDGDTATVPAGADVDLRDQTFAVADPAKGTVWATRVDPAVGWPALQEITKSRPVATLDAGTRMVVTDSGTVVAFSPTSDTLVTVPAAGDGFGAARTDKDLGQVADDTTLTTVGEHAVLLQPDGTLRVVGGPTGHVPAGSVLQQPGPDADSVLVGTQDALLEVDLDSGKATTVGTGSGTPVAPVRLGACEYAAWAASPSAVLTRCDGASAHPQQVDTSPGATLVFRVNRGQIVLNDTASGEVWGVDAQRLTTLDDWQTFRTKKTHQGKSEEENVRDGQRQVPIAHDDRFGVRPGRETVVHPLDNDFAPQGRLLSVTSVADVSGAEVQVSPDGQLLQVRLTGSGGASFRYTVDDGVPADKTSTATVRIDPARGNQRPEPRPHYTDPKLYVAAGGHLDIPVVRDWRDPDGDPLLLGSVSVTDASQGSVRALEGGIIRFTAPSKGGVVPVTYAVSDGHLDGETHTLQVHVQDASSTDPHAPVAAPDVVAGVVGSSITIHPLDNDLAGSDPGDPDAELELNGDVVSPAGTSAVTDQESGTVTFVAGDARTYLLDYTVGFGNAPLATGLIRVDVKARAGTAAPLTMPDTTAVYAGNPTLVDVIANDVDPGGAMLTVTDAVPAHPDLLTASVVDGRWVRIVPTGVGFKDTQTVSYTVSNGTQQAEGQVVVTPRDQPADPSPVTAPDQVTVRAGSTVTVPVLDNDISPVGDTLHLDADVAEGHSGRLPVEDADGHDDPARVGRAFAADGVVRYVAPSGSAGDTFTVDYVASDSHGNTAPGQLVVTVRPTKDSDQDPTPPTLQGRVTAGGTVRLLLPTTGADPDGDPVSITGITVPPAYGRVVDVRADSILYQAYPDSRGTDEFRYELADDRGGVQTGAVEVGIVGQRLPQPPQAVADELSAAPGSTVSVDVTANDHIEQGDEITVSLPSGQSGVSLASPGSTLVDVKVPEKASGDVTAVYELGDGAGSTTSSITVHVQKGYDNPPVVDSVFAARGAGERVTVDLLQNAYDPDGSRLRVTRVDARASVATLVGHRLTIVRGGQPRIVPFEVADSAGGVAAATVYVPARTVAVPQVKDDATIRLARGTGKPVAQRLASYAASSAGGPLIFAVKDRVWASPADLEATITGKGTFDVTAPKGFSGPGAVSFEVTTGRDATDPKGHTAVLTVPVQVGETRPVLTCPEDQAVEITQGARLSVPISTLCHVWTADPAAASDVTLQADVTGNSGLHVAADGQDVRITADPLAHRTDATLHVVAALGATRSAAVDIPVQIVAAKPPTLAPVDLRMRAGGHRTIDLAPYFKAGVQGGVGHVLSVGRAGLRGLHVTHAGGSRLAISVDAGTSGTAQVPVTMTDVDAKHVAARRRVVGRLSFQILDKPAAPTAPVPGVTVRSHEIHLTWRAPAAHGSPIDRYVLVGAGRRWTCPTTSCDAKGVPNQKMFRFRVSAHNALGWSAPSPLSRPAKADEKPAQVGPIRVTAVGNGSVSLAWSRPTNDASLDGYTVRWPGGARKTGKPRITITGLNNNAAYSFSVVAYNELGGGPARKSPSAHSIGTPGRPDRPNVNDLATTSDDALVEISWGTVNPNGPGPVTYTVLHNGTPLRQCSGQRGTSCRVSFTHDGSRHVFAVRATNAGVPGVKGGARRTSKASPSKTWDAVGKPAAWGAVSYTATGKDNQLRMALTVPKSRGKLSIIHFYSDGQDMFHGSRPARRYANSVHNVQSNSSPHTVWWTVCNERYCSESAHTRVQTYGPIRAKYVLHIKPRQRGHKVSWHVYVYNNGRPMHAKMATSVNDGNVRHFTGTTHGTANYDWVTPYRTVDYGKTVKFKIVLTDYHGADRGRVVVKSKPYVPRKGKKGSG
ncbi:Ig-like domain-containing protein [Nocardioides sp. DS6]|uniref:Ig-like domain-containing protein n=1 Tax=Nocardioides eburneus TaxID=3231482 RepID=A0ABV3SUQ7_9ACTN